MSKSTSVTTHSSLDRFTLGFEFDRTWHQAKENTKQRSASIVSEK